MHGRKPISTKGICKCGRSKTMPYCDGKSHNKKA
ncbi:MAG: CDGSH iron-sulfur domain-containing protein [Planctomycetota bacterium]